MATLDQNNPVKCINLNIFRGTQIHMPEPIRLPRLNAIYISLERDFLMMVTKIIYNCDEAASLMTYELLRIWEHLKFASMLK